MIEEIILNTDLPIKSKLTTLKTIVEDEVYFSVPIYQRLYVWEEDQVNTLLEDIYRAAVNKEDQYYLGGIMVTACDANNTFDLIDGQQRFTTLWLLSYELKRSLSCFISKSSNKGNHKQRISFSIRDFANKFLANSENLDHLSNDDKEQLENILIAKDTIKEFLKDKNEIEKLAFSNYIYSNLSFIQTEMPKDIDENRLFEVLNNRGEQLKHQDILKSKLIEQLPDNEKSKYAQLWDSCAIMDEYIEKNIKEISGLKWGDLTFNEADEEKEVGLPDDILKCLTETEYQTKLHFTDVLKEDFSLDGKEDDNFIYDSGKVRSIVSFPMFLLHSLRIFIYQKEGINSISSIEINEKKLLQIYKEIFYEKYLNEDFVKEFIELIWTLRVKFDKYVIKWVEIDDNVEHHLIKHLYQNKKTLQRRNPSSNSGFALLQSMLYHSQQIITHYWLTPFMNKMLTVSDEGELYSYLKKLDNVMFCTDMSGDLKTRSWKLLETDFIGNNLNISQLNNANGTSYWSYWFYKLDFILWHERRKEKEITWENFRMTKKNSVEHISPQNPKGYDENKVWTEEDDDETKKKKLDDFGNLVLITSSLNSSYGHKTFSEKRTTFIEKKRLDSLKSALIFDNDNWDWDLCQKHRIDMINLFEEYFKKTMSYE